MTGCKRITATLIDFVWLYLFAFAFHGIIRTTKLHNCDFRFPRGELLHIAVQWVIYSDINHLLRSLKISLQWRHNELDSISNQQPHDCLLNRLFRLRSKKTSKIRVTCPCEENSPVTGEFLAQRASNVENVSFDEVIMYISATTATPTTATNGDDLSFVVSLACQEALGSLTGLSPCHDTMGTDVTSLALCELRDPADKDALRAFAVSGWTNVRFLIISSLSRNIFELKSSM